MSDFKHSLISSFETRSARVAVIGLGYVGLPLAVALAEAGYRVTGLDVNAEKVAQLNAGESYITGITPARLRPLTESGNLQASCKLSAVAECQAISICVPTPLNKTGDPDVSHIVEAVSEAGRFARPGTVFVLESTTYPGTTREIVLPLLEGINPDLRLGESLFLAFSPERVDPGRTDWTTENTPRVIGGITPACLEVASAYYRPAIGTLVPVSSTDAAEMAKLLENTFRAINIGLANETLIMCDKLGLDAWEVIGAASTKPFGYMKFTPGPGIGGHCIPVDPLYLSWKLRHVQYHARFIELAAEINRSMPQYWVQKAQDALNYVGKPLRGSRVLVLGVAYKPETDDVRESPAVDIINLLHEKGASVEYFDPFVPTFKKGPVNMASVADLDTALADADCVILVTDHAAIRSAAPGRHPLLIDTRSGGGRDPRVASPATLQGHRRY